MQLLCAKTGLNTESTVTARLLTSTSVCQIVRYLVKRSMQTCIAALKAFYGPRLFNLGGIVGLGRYTVTAL